jgi:hypothetical protein
MNDALLRVGVDAAKATLEVEHNVLYSRTFSSQRHRRGASIALPLRARWRGSRRGYRGAPTSATIGRR